MKPLTIGHNDDLHKHNLAYLRIALWHIEHRHIHRAADILRTFDAAEVVRKDERNRYWPGAKQSKHTYKEQELRLEIRVAVMALSEAVRA